MVKGMMTYPMVLIFASIAVVLLIIVVVMPQFVQVFTKAGVPLPLPTRLMYELGLQIKQYWYVHLIVIATIVFGVKTYLKTEKGKDFFDRFILTVPVIGGIVKKSLVVRFTRTLATMLNTGVPLLQSLRVVRNVVENRVFARIIDDVYINTEKGEGINKALLSHRLIPKDVTYMVSIGEKSGNLPTMLNKVADFYENKVNYEIKDAMVLVEPIFISILGVCVGGIMASMILPMFDMVKTIQR
jgi:type IV pilus assembly protein PilC